LQKPICACELTRRNWNVDMENPKCPNCGREMTQVRVPEKPSGHQSFKCETCQIIFMVASPKADNDPPK
jgi:transposase-like protein